MNSATDDAASARPLVPRLHLVTDRRLRGDRGLTPLVAEAAAGGLGAVQLREKDLPGGDLLHLAEVLLRALGDTPLLVNERIDVALAAGAAGVHLPAAGLPTPAARRLVGPDRLVGRSVHSVEEARQAAAERIDYVVLGTIFATPSKPGRAPAGLPLVREVAAAVRLPVIAIGGIDERNAASVIGAGAHGVAVSSAILRAPDPVLVVERLAEIVAREGAWR